MENKEAPKAKEVSIEDLSKKTQKILKELQEITKINALLDQGLFPGKGRHHLNAASEFLKEEHYNRIKKLDKQDDIKNVEQIQAVIKDSKEAYQAEKKKGRK